MAVDEKTLIGYRRHLHQNPELSCFEHETAKWIAKELKSFGLHPEVGEHGAETGVVATIVGDNSGPTIAWRADTDALPIEELTGAPYASCSSGVMHACGHDVHTAVGLGLAKELSGRRAEIKGSVKFIFQPAEEGVPGSGIVGAEAMAQGGVLKEVDAVLALHCMPDIPAGKIGYSDAAVWAGSDCWKLTVKGVQTHGAYPQNGRDPIFAAAQIVTALQSIPGRVVDSRDCCVVSVGQFNAGTTFNVIPGEVKMVGLIRTLSAEVRERAVRAFKDIVNGICQANGVTCDIDISRGAEPVVNDASLVSLVRDSVAKEFSEHFVPAKPQMGAEDFASFSSRVPGAYFFLGVRNEERGIVHPIHSPHFDVDESCLPLATSIFSAALLRLGNQLQ